jgi:hypothetical protein
MSRLRNPERISYKIQVLIHDAVGDEFDASFPPGSDKRVSVGLSRILRPLVEEKLRELAREEREKARLAGQQPPKRAGAMSPVPRIPGIPAVPKLGGR